MGEKNQRSFFVKPAKPIEIQEIQLQIIFTIPILEEIVNIYIREYMNNLRKKQLNL